MVLAYSGLPVSGVNVNF